MRGRDELHDLPVPAAAEMGLHPETLSEPMVVLNLHREIQDGRFVLETLPTGAPVWKDADGSLVYKASCDNRIAEYKPCPTCPPPVIQQQGSGAGADDADKAKSGDRAALAGMVGGGKSDADPSGGADEGMGDGTDLSWLKWAAILALILLALIALLNWLIWLWLRRREGEQGGGIPAGGGRRGANLRRPDRPGGVGRLPGRYALHPTRRHSAPSVPRELTPRVSRSRR